MGESRLNDCPMFAVKVNLSWEDVTVLVVFFLSTWTYFVALILTTFFILSLESENCKLDHIYYCTVGTVIRNWMYWMNHLFGCTRKTSFSLTPHHLVAFQFDLVSLEVIEGELIKSTPQMLWHLRSHEKHLLSLTRARGRAKVPLYSIVARKLNCEMRSRNGNISINLQGIRFYIGEIFIWNFVQDWDFIWWEALAHFSGLFTLNSNNNKKRYGQWWLRGCKTMKCAP